MSMKQNLNFIKEEINNDEKMLEGLIRFEGWFKRYKIPLIALAVFVILLGIGYYANGIYTNMQNEKNYNFYSQALQGDEKALNSLKESKSKLYDLYLFKNAIGNNDSKTLKSLESSKDPIIARFAKAQNASLNKDTSTLSQNSLGEFALLEAAYLQIQKGDFKAADAILLKIPDNSPTKEIANALTHLKAGSEK
ncbi:hypothetical protein B6S12_06085 [Helicobacter valdiviensis]|uniref:Tetratricopeptide repeat-like domain-containing protein n=1 Tax=Helicobacter valdiviensis TaxID=1458358 RepID=A0A2W6MVP3_9HELI|nr:hypothetical protein [Helicobacter valdiviensis]PZT48031.1 hypothetical protein B6S12_06085 [Helicobacter valdiviensis]